MDPLELYDRVFAGNCCRIEVFNSLTDFSRYWAVPIEYLLGLSIGSHSPELITETDYPNGHFGMGLRIGREHPYDFSRHIPEEIDWVLDDHLVHCFLDEPDIRIRVVGYLRQTDYERLNMAGAPTPGEFGVFEKDRQIYLLHEPILREQRILDAGQAKDYFEKTSCCLPGIPNMWHSFYVLDVSLHMTLQRLRRGIHLSGQPPYPTAI